MDRNSTIEGIMRSAGKGSEHQQIRECYRIDGLDCYEPDNDPNMITFILTFDTEDLKKQIQEALNEREKDDLRWELEKALEIKDGWLKNKKLC